MTELSPTRLQSEPSEYAIVMPPASSDTYVMNPAPFDDALGKVAMYSRPHGQVHLRGDQLLERLY